VGINGGLEEGLTLHRQFINAKDSQNATVLDPEFSHQPQSSETLHVVH
jgi:hypothetical protein